MPIRKSEKTGNAANIKKQLEALTGHKIDFSAEQLIKVLRYPIGAYDYTDGSAAWKWIIFPGKSCSNATLLDASGVSFTEADGTRAFLLSDFVCFPELRASQNQSMWLPRLARQLRFSLPRHTRWSMMEPTCK